MFFSKSSECRCYVAILEFAILLMEISPQARGTLHVWGAKTMKNEGFTHPIYGWTNP